MKVDTDSLKLSRNYDEGLKLKVFGDLKVKKPLIEGGEPHNPIREHFKSNQIKFFGKLDGATKPLTDKIVRR